MNNILTGVGEEIVFGGYRFRRDRRPLVCTRVNTELITQRMIGPGQSPIASARCETLMLYMQIRYISHIVSPFVAGSYYY